MSKRNTDAVCGTCPYFYRQPDGPNIQYGHGECRVKMSNNRFSRVTDDCWCGDHPDFWKAGSKTRGMEIESEPS